MIEQNANRQELHATGFRALLQVGIERLGADEMERLLNELGVSSAKLSDSSAWFSLGLAESILEELEARTGDPAFLSKVAAVMVSRRNLGALYPLVRAFGTPAFTYGQMASIGRRVNKVGESLVTESAPSRVRICYRMLPGAPREREVSCRFRTQQLASIPTLFGQQPARVEHPECMQAGAETCIYDVRWIEPPRHIISWLSSSLGVLVGFSVAVVATLSWLPGLCAAAVLGFSGWTAGRIIELKRDLAGRVRDLEEHRDALTRSEQANEQRYAQLLEAKAEVDAKVHVRTRELEEATARLSDTLSQIQAVDRAKTDFFNNVSHELRSPLTLILAPLEDLVAGRNPPGGTRAALSAMQLNAARLLHLINQLLDLAKIDAGAMKIAPVALHPASFVRGILGGFESAAARKDISVVLSAPEIMPSMALDPSWIESAVTNLVDNALRMTRTGGTVRVSVEDGGADVSIAVSDDGPGISAEDQKKVFERFAQGDAKKGVVGGTGIGLAMVREAARLHGGDATLHSELGRGATFVLRLPRRPGTSLPPAGPRPLTAPPPALPGDTALENAMTADRDGPGAMAPLALVVEDNPELRVFMADVLCVRYRVRSAADGGEALEIAKRSRPDVIVSDVAMPTMDGYALCRALRDAEETRGVPVLLVTARTDISSVLNGFEAGASDYVLKPFHGRELLARVDVHVQLRRTVQELALQERHAMLGVLAASIAHQVRNPLTTLVSGLPAMRGRLGGKVDNSTGELMDVMVECAERIERLTRDLLDLSRVDREEGGMYRPSDGLRAALRLFRGRAAIGVVIEEKIDHSELTEGRVGDMNHVFLNLLDNALHAVGDSGTIRVSGVTDGHYYVTRVEDSGPGVDEETAAKIFEPFFTTRPAGSGTGLGLAIARQVVNAAGGTIEVGRSDLGGAMFTTRIPIAARALSSAS